ncbi:hypothetical protein COT64_03205 [Candidatus Shapirobacteria bacterium CG09_land_8_20_14_0_10_39_12]|uniref:Glycosyltransferase 2-like domain-containing protein n=1 Tax=Candidatus Shapirobacteria bacterium CG09_land_8_20_14_0_10_39_12 TaxID=1974885 RepID=A0A2H0WNX5_9BACT|nr:MAG: hypothetical protein COT64_03205 [Candidatus Shapirobacteria bacterium CG09_land_8_20_14_0_10_39_12]
MISAIILTKNEEKNIRECLLSVSFCDEVLVIDDNSTDKTAEIADKFGAKVIKHSLDNDFGQQRNFGLEKAKGNWVLFVDADERVGSESQDEIKEKTKTNTVNGFCLKRIDFFMGRWLKHGEISSIKLLRLGRKNCGRWERTVDEIWKIKGTVGTLNKPLLHYSHPDLTQFLENINQRSTLNADYLFNEGKKNTLLEWLKPLAKFIRSYFFNLGFLDKTAGFVFAVLMSMHSFNVRVKLYLLIKRHEK